MKIPLDISQVLHVCSLGNDRILIVKLFIHTKFKFLGRSKVNFLQKQYFDQVGSGYIYARIFDSDVFIFFKFDTVDNIQAKSELRFPDQASEIPTVEPTKLRITNTLH